MSFSSRDAFNAFENQQKAIGQVSSLDDQEPQMIDVASAGSNSSSPSAPGPNADEPEIKHEKLRPIPKLSDDILGANTQSPFFKPSADGLVYQSAFFNLKEHSVLTQVCKAGYFMFQQPLTDARLPQLLDAAVRGEKDVVEKIIKTNPHLMYLSGNTVDYSGRTHQGRTALQIAYGAVDRSITKTVGMVEMLEDYLSKMPDGYNEIARQYDQQFPDGWEAAESFSITNDLAALHKIMAVITSATPEDCALAHAMDNTIQEHNSVLLKQIVLAVMKANSNDDFEIAFTELQSHLQQSNIIKSENLNFTVLRAIYEFRNYLEPKRVYTTGKHFNLQLLAETARLYDANYESFGNHWESPKNLLCWQKVFGYVQRFIPACDAQLIAQSLYYVFEKGENSRRILVFRNGNTRYFPVDSNLHYRLGYHFAAGTYAASESRSGMDPNVPISKLCQAKNIAWPRPQLHAGTIRAGVE
ncbi:MAG: hypothetical protein P4M12_04400 [Gammaproteobacteria bacterium]|nr:hypothetical protein [Gammaproteobacteria bacterium]